MLKNDFKRATQVTLLSIASASVMAEAALDATQQWNDMSDPTAVFSSASIGGGTEGIDLSLSYGGYLGGVYKHRIDVAAKHDLEFYEANYLLLNANTQSGMAFESTWDRDIKFKGVNYKNVNDTSLGFFAKLGFMNDRLNVYPKVDIGYMWANHMKDTTYVAFDATTRYTFNPMFWVGVTPTYTYGMKGLDLSEWTATFDVGMQLSTAFGLSASVNNDEEFWGQVIFAF